VLVIGGAHVDRQARLLAPHRPATSNPVSGLEQVGGGALNAARAMRRFGLHVSLLSARSADAAGTLVEQALAEAGIEELSSVHLDRPTPSYTAILEPDGELVTAIADMGLYEAALGKSLRRAPVLAAAAGADALLCDANMLSPAIGVAIELADGKPVFALAISAGKAPRLEPYLGRFEAVFLNRFEAEALTGLSNTRPAAEHAVALAERGVRRAIVTAGAADAALLDDGRVHLLSPPSITVADVIGAGDALAGTTIAGLLRGMPMIEAARLGIAAAALTASRVGPSPAMTLAEISALAETIRIG
jgi:pseudouridine kinase